MFYANETEEKKFEEKITVGNYTHGPRDGEKLTIEGLSAKSYKKLLAAIRTGKYWIRVVEGKLKIRPAWKRSPDPINDPEMQPFWRKPTGHELSTAATLIDLDPDFKPECNSPSIILTSLCVFDWTPENYKKECEKVKSFGFECLRSRRDEHGAFSELWHLPGLWSAEGTLKDFIENSCINLKCGENSKKMLQLVIDFLCQHISFGSLDVCVQRAAMPNPD